MLFRVFMLFRVQKTSVVWSGHTTTKDAFVTRRVIPDPNNVRTGPESVKSVLRRLTFHNLHL
jgi:hypothetical protein